MAKKFSEKADKKMDKRMGIKENSKSDIKKDKKMTMKPMMEKMMNRNIGKDHKPKIMSKSTAAKQARKGKDMGKPGKNFSKIAASAGKKYGSAAAGKRVAGAIFQKMRAKGKL